MIPADRVDANEERRGTEAGAATAAGSASRLPTRLRNTALIVTTGLLWGLQPALIKALSERGLPQVATLGLIMVVVAAALGAVLAVRGGLPRFSPRVAVFLAIAGGAEYAGPLVVAFLVARHLDAGLLTLLMFTTPVFAVALAAALDTEKLDGYGVLGCLCGLAGLLVIALPQNALPSPDMLPWCLAALSVPAMYALGAVYLAKTWPKDLDAVQVAFGGASIAGLALVPFWAGSLHSGHYLGLSGTDYLLFLALAVCVTVEIVLFFYTLRHAGPVFASFASFLAIVTGFVVSALFFGERPSRWVWASVVLFSLALGLIIVRPQKAKHPN
jgi:drug/metabolite transporter (DMT)-like permease